MNRRTILAAVGGLSAFGFVGYLISEMRLSLPVLIRVMNETDTDRNVAITAYEVDTDRQTFDASFNVPVDSTATPGRLSNSDAYVEVVLMEPLSDSDDGEETAIADTAETFTGENTQRLTVYITDDGLEIDEEYRE
ncbi:hypothetical protein [Halovivax gelatinilyticus]|uniref:hypothetical protein n=1 Tax=Halovivax gelatinilyticus TaxID=2961597 RepID=UPI0020CA7B54|nr:hypothetical protein [Halovivax gelatinilyticus]